MAKVEPKVVGPNGVAVWIQEDAIVIFTTGAIVRSAVGEDDIVAKPGFPVCAHACHECRPFECRIVAGPAGPADVRVDKHVVRVYECDTKDGVPALVILVVIVAGFELDVRAVAGKPDVGKASPRGELLAPLGCLFCGRWSEGHELKLEHLLHCVAKLIQPFTQRFRRDPCDVCFYIQVPSVCKRVDAGCHAESERGRPSAGQLWPERIFAFTEIDAAVRELVAEQCHGGRAHSKFLPMQAFVALVTVNVTIKSATNPAAGRARNIVASSLRESV